jgi:NAD(P)H-nitrite reductase large subunit
VSIVCHCFEVEKARVIAAIEAGCDSVDAVRNKLGVTGNCASCLPDIEDLLEFYGRRPEDPAAPPIPDP